MEARIEGFPSLAGDLGRGFFPSLSGGGILWAEGSSPSVSVEAKITYGDVAVRRRPTLPRFPAAHLARARASADLNHAESAKHRRAPRHHRRGLRARARGEKAEVARPAP